MLELNQFGKKISTWLWQEENNKATAWHRKLWRASRIFIAVIRDLFKGYISLHAMGLVYTTILSVVPFLALSFSVLKGFGVHNQLEPVLDNILAAPLGDRGPEVVVNLLHFVDNIKVGVLGSVGLGLLIYTVISLIQKIERSFNEIWQVNNTRSFAQRFSSYLSVIMVGPVLVFSAVGATAAFFDSTWIQELLSIEVFGWVFTLLSRLTPYLIIIGLFTFLYTFIPNTRVKLKHAFVGGLVAGVIWQTTIFGFTLFVASSTQYTAIYSGFAIGILLLIWVYLAWLILLVGASVAFYSQHSQQITKNRVYRPCAKADEIAGLSIMYFVAKKFDETGGGSHIATLSENLALRPETSHRLVNKMLAKNLLVVTGGNLDSLAPAQSLDKITLRVLLNAIREEDMPTQQAIDPNIENIISKIEASTHIALGQLTIADWVRNNEITLLEPELSIIDN